MKSYMSVVANILNKKKPETILDTPSGSGWLLSLLSYDPEIDGIDLFEEKPKGYRNFFKEDLDNGISDTLLKYNQL